MATHAPPPPDVAAAAAIVDRWVAGEEAADRARAHRATLSPLEQMTPTERFNHQRTEQARAAAAGIVLPSPPAPAPAPARTDLTAAERWGAWRNPRS